MSIRITTLGSVQVVRGDTVISALPSQRMRCALLIYLAVNRQVPRERLLAMFWPEKTDDRARHALSQNIYELRRVLGDDWLEIRGEQLVAAPHISVDVHAFEQSVERGDYSMALGLYRGTFLDGFFVPNVQAFETWVDSVRQRVQRHHRRARREGIRLLIDGARLKEALASARDWAAHDPSDDEAQHRLIELLAETGDRAGAIRQYELYQKTLAAEELQPLDETRALVDRIRGGDVGPLPMPSAVQPARPPRREPVAEEVVVPLALETQAEVQPAAPEVTARAEPRLRQARWLGAIAAAVVVAFSFAIYRLTAGTAPPLAERPPVAVAVLPLDDNTPPPGAEFLADGLTQELISAFSGFDPVMTVRSKQHVARYKGSATPLDSIARALFADVLIRGNVVRADGRVRVNAELVDGKTGVVLESVNAERVDGELFPLVDDLVRKLDIALRSRIGVEIERQRRRDGAPNVLALQTLSEALRNAYNSLRFVDQDPAATRREIARADSILVRVERNSGDWLEPTLGRARLAEWRAVIERQHRNGEQARAWLDTSMSHVDRAVARSGNTSLMLEARGAARYRLAQLGQLDRAETDSIYMLAEQDLRRASVDDPFRSQAHALYASLLFSMGRFSESNAAALRAARLDAFYRQAFETYYTLGITYFEMGKDTLAANMCREGLDRYFDWKFAYCRLYVMAFSDGPVAAEPDTAWAILRHLTHGKHKPDGVDNTPNLELFIAGVLLRVGQRDSALAVLRRASAKPPAEATAWIRAAIWYKLNQPDSAAAILIERARLGPLGPAVSQNRAINPVLGDPRVTRVLTPPG